MGGQSFVGIAGTDDEVARLQGVGRVFIPEGTLLVGGDGEHLSCPFVDDVEVDGCTGSVVARELTSDDCRFALLVDRLVGSDGDAIRSYRADSDCLRGVVGVRQFFHFTRLIDHRIELMVTYFSGKDDVSTERLASSGGKSFRGIERGNSLCLALPVNLHGYGSWQFGDTLVVDNHRQLSFRSHLSLLYVGREAADAGIRQRLVGHHDVAGSRGIAATLGCEDDGVIVARLAIGLGCHLYGSRFLACGDGDAVAVGEPGVVVAREGDGQRL